jgi:hypothetical protein
MSLTLKARNDEKDGLEVGGGPLMKTDYAKRNRDRYVPLEECDLSEMALMKPRGSLDGVWQENWREMLNELGNTTVKIYVRRQRYHQHRFLAGELGRVWPGSATRMLQVNETNER